MARKFNLRDALDLQDISDIVVLAGSLRKMLSQTGKEFERRGEQTARRLQHDVQESHIVEDLTAFMDRLVRLVARKRREFEKKGQKTVEQLKSDIRESPVVEGVEETAARIHTKAEQKRYEAAKRIVKRHEQRQQDNGDVGFFVLGAFLGAVIGTIAAFWLAPRSGEATRRELQMRTNDLKDDIEQAAEEARRKVEGESISDAINTGKAEARRFQETMGDRRL